MFAVCFVPAWVLNRNRAGAWRAVGVFLKGVCRSRIAAALFWLSFVYMSATDGLASWGKATLGETLLTSPVLWFVMFVFAALGAAGLAS